ncbi:hypothetical protein [Corynebacterium gallinarum]|uniref:Uncharacterized protein n=1 Tax=Corynebacterium gallinarum TaxID=2762214 RepID=A0A8I0HPL9_9CORY|nr:hypothetical protein [Corynebacterium gallinarum]MBD8030614.1 hypothetical protein [Corynebacterium gallinarum]
MKSSLTVAGDVTSALTYFATMGIAQIAEVEISDRASIVYSSDPFPKAELHFDEVTPAQVADALRFVAQRWTQPGSWVVQTMPYPEGQSVVERSPFSPRVKVINDLDTWQRHQRFRLSHLDKLLVEADLTALELIGGLGEPAYWRFQGKDRRPDHGASRWEMKTRNKGQEFIKDRLALMCVELSDWSTEQILAGLDGSQVNDPLGKNASDSRTSTGFTSPGPTDVALAFAAIIGISIFPLSHQSHTLSITPAAFPSDILHTRYAVLPIPVVPVTLARLKTIILSHELHVVSSHELMEPEAEKGDSRLLLDGLAASTWLRQRGIVALAKYPVLKTGSSSAPERQILKGEVVVL